MLVVLNRFALSLNSFYHVANNAAARAWVLVGGAIRIAIVGLNRPLFGCARLMDRMCRTC